MVFLTDGPRTIEHPCEKKIWTINSNILNRKILEIKFLEDDIGKNIDNYGVR